MIPRKCLQITVQDLRARFILVTSEASGLLDGIVDKVVAFSSLETLAAVIDKEPRSVKPEYVAYVLYTSGSTGKPESVVIEHRALSTSISIKSLGKASEYPFDTGTLQFAAKFLTCPYLMFYLLSHMADAYAYQTKTREQTLPRSRTASKSPSPDALGCKNPQARKLEDPQESRHWRRSSGSHGCGSMGWKGAPRQRLRAHRMQL